MSDSNAPQNNHEHVYRKHHQSNTMFCVTCHQPKPDAPQASPTIQELLDEIFNEHTVALTSFTDDHGDTITDMDRVVIDVPKSKQAILTLFSRIITEARPPIIDTDNRQKVYERDEAQQWYDKGQNDTIKLYERNLRAAIEGKQ